MDRSSDSPLFDRLIAPWPLFLGVAVSFLACALAGYLASRQNHFQHFERFHPLTTPQSLFYPTACQVRALARSRLDSKKIAVIVGGSSILQGSWQTPAGLWTRKLQALLGERYQVINFGFPGAGVAEFGATAAEMLARDYPRLILIADLPAGFINPDPDGHHFKYFFWDAYYQGLLLPHPERDNRLREQAEELEEVEPTPGQAAARRLSPKGEQQAELKAEMRLNSALYFNDLWNTLAYTHCHTVWTQLTRASFTRARQHYPDSELVPPPGHVPNLRDNGDSLRNHLAAFSQSAATAWSAFDRCATTAFPRPTRKRTLLLVTWFNPLYLDKLSPEQRACYTRVCRTTVEHLRDLRFAAVEVNQDCKAVDFADFCHLVESGGARMAAAVAPRVRQLARRLGYTR